MDDDDFEVFEVNGASPTSRITLQAVLAVLFAGLDGLISQVAGIFEGFSTLFLADHNYRVERQQMQEQAAREIETLVSGEPE